VLPAQPAGGWATALPELTVDRHADDPLAALRTFVESSGKRVLLTVESAGRRETILQLLAEHRLRPTSNDHFAGWLDSDAPFALGVAPLASGFAVPAEATRSSPKPSCTPLGRRAGAGARNRRATSTRWCATCPS
jgi:transcription-repair coupling factor (superfamily II helicase)